MYSIPIAFVSGFMILEDLEEKVPPIGWLLCVLGVTVRNLVAAFLPSLTLTLFLSMLPKVCAIALTLTLTLTLTLILTLT